MKTLITGGVIVNEGRSYRGDLLVDGDRIATIMPAPSEYGAAPSRRADRVIDATGCLVLPGIIDSHVHFREPGLTDKATIDTESRAAAAGGVTTFFDMPNTLPQTTTLDALREKQELAARSSHVGHAFFFGATNDNAHLLPQLDVHRVPGVKLFMGSSTGNMLVDQDDALHRIFASPVVSGPGAAMPLVAHCEDTATIERNLRQLCDSLHTDDPDVRLHPLVRSREACMASTIRAIGLAIEHQTRLHVAHVSTEDELDLIPANCPHTLTAEATVGHLLFSTVDYARLGARIKVNPAIKDAADRAALRRGLVDGRITTIATDHAPHLLTQKEGGCRRAASGMPMVQFSLPLMLGLTDEGVLTVERLVQLMAHQPAQLFALRHRGFLRPDYMADIAIVRPNTPWVVTPDCIESRCGWSPIEGQQLTWRVEYTLCNGHLVCDHGHVDTDYIAPPVTFR